MSNTPPLRSPPSDRGRESRDPGLTLTDQHPANAIATVDVDGRPPADVWNELARSPGFRDRLVRSVRDGLRGLTLAETYDVLADAGVTALGGSYADLARDVARGDSRGLWTLLRATAEFGQPRDRRSVLGVGIDAPLSAVANGPLAVLGLTDTDRTDGSDTETSGTETIAVRIGAGFREQRADQRRALCSLLADLAQAFDVRLVASGLTRRFLATEHRGDLPGVSDPCNDSPRAGRLAALVDDALGAIDPDGRPMSILRQIAADPAETLSYHALASDGQVSRSRVRQCVGRLREFELVATYDDPKGTTVDLLPAGGELIETFDKQIGRQRRLDECVSETGKPSLHTPCSPARAGGPPTAGRDSEAEASATDAAVARDGQRVYAEGAVDVRSLNRREYAAAVAGAESAGIGLVDHAFDLETDRDGREPGVYYDRDADRLVVSAEYANPHQHVVATANALTSTWLFRHVLPADRLDGNDDGDGDNGDLAGLTVDDLDVLRNCRNLGHLPDRAANGADYIDELRAAREQLLEMTSDMKAAEREGDTERRDVLRSEATKVAIGLVGTMTHLLDLAGVDVVQELRLPEFSRHLGSKTDQRADLVKHLALRTAIEATYGQHVVYRQLFEDRPRKRQSAFSVDVDAADPFGSLVTSFVLVGPGVSSLETDLRDGVRNPAAVHEDAPEFALRVPIRDRTDSRSAYAQAVRSMCSAKDLTASRSAVTFCRALTGSPYDTADALHGLAPESKAPGRDIALDEVRYALSTLSSNRILPDASPTVSKVVHALLTAVEPLSQRELADRAGVSPRSVRSHRAVLEAFDLVRETESKTESESDGGLRFALPFRDERDSPDRGAAVLPSYAVGSPDRAAHTRASDVLFGVVDRLIADPSRLGDPDDPIGGAFFDPGGSDAVSDRLCRPDAWPWLSPWVSLLRALCDVDEETDVPDREQRSVVMGEDPTQAALAPDSSADRRGRSTAD
jgi:hypothetical protein